jgi:hypothetical protein
LITEFERKIENKDTFAEAITHQSRAAPFPKDAGLRMAHAGREKERYTYKTTTKQSLSNESSARLTRQRGHKQPTPRMQGL